ncbi:hypothetical protein FSP39_000624 [Pinctada imbricata]|uniref:CUB domain-containing protein n=1 Tax=Pinctada imbricata TaxID=66713 RepID=A0AA88YC69_PINIB|nr:hypothetical protein FSP39_000624 [Pinctada imbricata]
MDIKPRYRRSCADYLRLYLNLDGPEVNEYSKHDHELCGNITDLDQKTYFSKDRALIMEFHSDKGFGNFTGFKGRYRFIDKTQFKTSGLKKDGFPCSYDFHSFHNNTKGYFFSPLYPQNYPANSKCSYTFYGHAIDERVKIIFMNIQLQQGTDPRNCDTNTDYIIIYDGLDSYARKKQVLCGLRNNELVVSNASNLYIEFRSDSTIQGKGFGATYEFIPKNIIPTQLPYYVVPRKSLLEKFDISKEQFCKERFCFLCDDRVEPTISSSRFQMS